jgi:hypothetical protein
MDAQHMDLLENGLKRLGLDRELVRLNVAQAFVLDVTPGQLRRILALPLVGRVRPNRTHRVPKSAPAPSRKSS